MSVCRMLGFAESITDPSQWLVAFVVAPFVGSFLGVLIMRLPAGEPVVLARSACARCGARLRPRELVPLVSYLLQRGRCRHCHAPIGRFHLAVELAAIGVVAWVWLAESNPERFWIDCLLGWVLLALAWIDGRVLLLPDVLTLPLLLAGLLVTLMLQPQAVALHAEAAAAAYLALRAISWCYRLLRGRDGMGAGDAKLLAAAGAWLGPAALPLTLLAAALLGIALAVALAVSGRRMVATTALPFGTCIAAAFWLVWLHGGWFGLNGGIAWFA